MWLLQAAHFNFFLCYFIWILSIRRALPRCRAWV